MPKFELLLSLLDCKHLKGGDKIITLVDPSTFIEARENFVVNVSRFEQVVLHFMDGSAFEPVKGKKYRISIEEENEQ